MWSSGAVPFSFPPFPPSFLTERHTRFTLPSPSLTPSIARGVVADVTSEFRHVPRGLCELPTLSFFAQFHQEYFLSLLTLTFRSNSFFTTLNFIQNIIIISICHTNRMSLYAFFSWIMLQKFLGMSWKYLVMTILRRGCSVVHVVAMIYCCSGCYFQYQLVFSCMDQKYCALKTNSPAEITCP